MLLAICFVTQVCEGTNVAFWIPCGADVATEQNNAVAEIRTFLRRQDCPQLPFHLLGVFAFAQA